VSVQGITLAFRILVVTVPPVAGVVVWRVMVGIRASGAAGFLQMPIRAVVAVGAASGEAAIQPETHEESVKFEKAREEGEPEPPVTDELQPTDPSGSES
jgi:hypothetical protein